MERRDEEEGGRLPIEKKSIGFKVSNGRSVVSIHRLSYRVHGIVATLVGRLN